MLNSFLSMQNAMMATNMAQMNMLSASDRMLNAATNVNFGNSQPLKPNFAGLDNDELIIKANETKLAVAKKLYDAYRKKLAKNLQNSAPKYAGLDFKA